jgi:hypothetical protein
MVRTPPIRAKRRRLAELSVPIRWGVARCACADRSHLILRAAEQSCSNNKTLSHEDGSEWVFRRHPNAGFMLRSALAWRRRGQSGGSVYPPRRRPPRPTGPPCPTGKPPMVRLHEALEPLTDMQGCAPQHCAAQRRNNGSRPTKERCGVGSGTGSSQPPHRGAAQLAPPTSRVQPTSGRAAQPAALVSAAATETH